ncbi:hypothetical protein BOTBODRAFT_191676 [Botryobasidium botryosum FD-172 SS1]|uniref:NAD(P)-binding protein n=1 Tax=Botryobasidium botryosum (strain FD-172 SS1) TaxID=930990 RepID=A0A067LZ45_BOTB1|nr:hypothetical protein BOTBODRAFT_191676 [Botryobasidium botryosum FD-172 SS1]
MEFTAHEPLVWLITGTSTGFGNALARAVLSRGDTVVATSRSTPIDLEKAGAHALPLDVTWGLDKLKETVDGIVEQHGRIDVLVNNAGYALFGAIEEATPEETFDQFNTNVFGAINVARAVLPHMRARKSGTIVWIGSLGGWQAVPSAGLYVTTKYAIRGIAETMQAELSSISEDLRSIYLEAGHFRTTFLSPSHRTQYSPRINDYTPLTDQFNTVFQAYDRRQPGDPERFVRLLIDFVNREGRFAGRKLPTGIPAGSDAYEAIGTTCRNTLQVLEEWEDVIKSTDYPVLRAKPSRLRLFGQKILARGKGIVTA